MVACYKRLWKLLIDRDMLKKDLMEAANLSTASMAKLGKNGNVTMDVLVRICTVLECSIEDIVEIIPGDPPELRASTRGVLAEIKKNPQRDLEGVGNARG